MPTRRCRCASICEGGDTGAGRASLGDSAVGWDRNRTAPPLRSRLDADRAAHRTAAARAAARRGRGKRCVAGIRVRRLGWRSLSSSIAAAGSDSRSAPAWTKSSSSRRKPAAQAFGAQRCIDAAVVMSHNYSMDLRHLGLARGERHCATSDCSDRSRAGSPARATSARTPRARLRGRLHAPVGLPLGGSGPDVLALSIACGAANGISQATAR